MKLAVLTIALAGCNACQPSPPAPQPPTITTAAVTVYDALVNGGCMANDPTNGALSVQEEMLSDREPPWLKCMVDGGSVQACGTPCSK